METDRKSYNKINRNGKKIPRRTILSSVSWCLFSNSRQLPLSSMLLWVILVSVSVFLAVQACQPPDLPVGGYYMPAQPKYEPGDKIKYFCYRGYMRIGRDTRTCKLDSKWTDQTPFCDWPVKLKNPMSSTSSTSVHRTIDNNTGSCFSSNRGTGEDFRVYMSYPAVIYAIRLFLPKGPIRLDIATVRNGQRKRCSMVNRLLEEKQWITITCDEPSTSDSIYVQDITDIKNVLEICEVEIYVKDTVWCKTPPDIFIPHGWLEVSREKATLQCAEGYKPGDNRRIVCDNNENWSGGVLQCDEILCERRFVNNTGGEWILVGKGSKFSAGILKRLKCEQGYTIVGSPDTIKCLPNGTWTSSTARCEGKPPSSNSDLTYRSIIIASSVVATIVILTCFLVFIILALKKKSEPVVVVLKRGDEVDNAMIYNETEYSSITYETVNTMPNIGAKYPTPPASRPPIDMPGDYSKPNDQYPPPYNAPPTYIQPTSDTVAPLSNENCLLGTLKSSPVYTAS